VATTVAILTPDASCGWKILILLVLALSHLPADALPHLHYYSFTELKKGLLGALVELGGGLIVLPLAVLLLTHLEWWWLAACVLAASLFDFLVAAKIKLITHLNHRAHWWDEDERTSYRAKVLWEAGQTIVLLSILALAIYYHLA